MSRISPDFVKLFLVAIWLVPLKKIKNEDLIYDSIIKIMSFVLEGRSHLNLTKKYL